MSGSAFRAFYPADTKPDLSGWHIYGSIVVTMDRKTGRMRAGTSQLMERSLQKNRIIKRLRNFIAITDKNGYHSIVTRHRVTCV